MQASELEGTPIREWESVQGAHANDGADEGRRQSEKVDCSQSPGPLRRHTTPSRSRSPATHPPTRVAGCQPHNQPREHRFRSRPSRAAYRRPARLRQPGRGPRPARLDGFAGPAWDAGDAGKAGTSGAVAAPTGKAFHQHTHTACGRASLRTPRSGWLCRARPRPRARSLPRACRVGHRDRAGARGPGGRRPSCRGGARDKRDDSDTTPAARTGMFSAGPAAPGFGTVRVITAAIRVSGHPSLLVWTGGLLSPCGRRDRP